jgi:hypothetical protein
MAQPRPPVVDGADLSLGAFLLMPIFAAGLSVAMWLEMPTFGRALQARAQPILARRALFKQLGDSLPAMPVQHSGCVEPLSPPPHFEERNAAATNMAILAPGDLIAMGAPQTVLGADRDLYLNGQVMWLVRWIGDPPSSLGRRMSRARIAAEIERPIESNRYVLFYGTRDVSPSANDPSATLRVDAHLFDVGSKRRLCEIGFVAPPESAAERLLHEVDAAATATAR